MTEKVILCKLYKRRSRKTNKEYLVGKINTDTSIMLMKNEDRQQQSDGDYELVLFTRDSSKRHQLQNYAAKLRGVQL